MQAPMNAQRCGAFLHQAVSRMGNLLTCLHSVPVLDVGIPAAAQDLAVSLWIVTQQPFLPQSLTPFQLACDELQWLLHISEAAMCEAADPWFCSIGAWPTVAAAIRKVGKHPQLSLSACLSSESSSTGVRVANSTCIAQMSGAT